MYSVVLLIGSTKFKDVFLEVEEKLALKGYLIFTPSVYNQSGEVPECGVDTKKIQEIVFLGFYAWRVVHTIVTLARTPLLGILMMD